MWILNYNDLLFCSNKYHYLCDTHKINNGTSEHNMEQTMTIYGLTIFMNCPTHTYIHTYLAMYNFLGLTHAYTDTTVLTHTQTHTRPQGGDYKATPKI